MKSFMLTTKDYEGRYLEVSCQQIPDPEHNCSEIRWTLSVKGGQVSWYSTGPTRLVIDGQEVWYCKRKSYTTKTFPAAKGSVEGSLTVTHGQLGERSVEISLETAIYTATTSTVSEVWQLEDLQRASRIRAADANIGSCATVVIGRSSSRFTHAVAYRFGQLSGWLDGLGDPVAEPVRHGETTLNFLLPESFYQQIPDKPRDSCQLRCITYLDDREIGETDCSFTVTADPAVCGPAVSCRVEPGDPLTLSLEEQRLIPGYSTALCHVEATAQKGAWLVSVTAGDVSVTDGQALLPGWSLPAVPVVAVDSRGYETRLEVPCRLVDYRPPTNLSEVARPAPTADSAILTLRGSAYAGAFQQTENWVEALVEFDGRQLSVPLEPDQEGNFLLQVTLEELAYTRNYPVTVTVRDLVTDTPRSLTLQKGIPVFDWGENDFRFHVPVDLPALTVNGRPLTEYLGGS